MKRKDYLLIAIIALLSVSACISPTKFNGVTTISDEERTRRRDEALEKLADYGAPSKFKIGYLLTRHDFQTLEKWFENILQQYKQDVQFEWYLDRAYNAFSQEIVTLNDLDLWVASTGSYIAYAARGIHKAEQGFNARGIKFINETRPGQISEMQRCHDEAAKDLLAAIRKQPSLMPAYVWLLYMAKSSNMPYTAKEILQQAEEQDKRTYSARSSYLDSLQPKWGGSFEEMNAYAKQLMPYLDLNPRLWDLQGNSYYLQAFELHREKKYEAAVQLYTEALKYGETQKRLNLRASAYSAMGREDLAGADLKKFRAAVARDTSSDSIVGTATDLEGSKYEISEKTVVDPHSSLNKIGTYLVLPVEQTVPWGEGYEDVGGRVARRNADRIELMIMRLGKECVDRIALTPLLKKQKISMSKISIEDALTVGKAMNAQAVIMTTINSRGFRNSSKTYFEGIIAKAVSVNTGQVLWESELKGSVVPADSVPYYLFELIYNSVETKLYDALEQRLNASTQSL